ncbi:MAG: PmoA family protein [Bacilli bacterium]|nr:PmoA family protein [Bacilli bacterium]
MYVGLVVTVILLAFINCTKAGSIEFRLEVEPTNYSSKEVPVHVEVKLPLRLQKIPVEQLSVTLKSADEKFRNVPGQIVETVSGKYELWWILPITNSNEPVQWIANITHGDSQNVPTFKWENRPDKHLDLFFDGKREFRYDYELDNHFEKGKTYAALNKPFYHIYDLKGENMITNEGLEESEFPHHKGIMIGWRRLGFNGENISFWGMEDLNVQKHMEFNRNVAGPVVAETEALIQWNDSSGVTIIEERRQAIIYRQSSPDILLMDFTSSLKAVNGPVILDGDANHAGVQFRAHNDVAKGAPGAKKATYYFHQDSINPLEDFNLPWVAMSYGLNNKSYSILQMNNPDNPDPTIWSAYRDYGRFGPFPRKDLDANETLTLHYRFWISESDMPDRDVLSSKYNAFIEPVKIHVLSP